MTPDKIASQQPVQKWSAERLIEIIGAFLRLGCISFGGPAAHLGYLREEFVGKRLWLDDASYSDLVALCQFLPGPSSSQVVFALGMKRAGITGALLASLCFTMPSAILMILFAYSVTFVGDLKHAGWLHGLKLAAVAVVAQAVWGMGQKLCPDRQRTTIAMFAAGIVLCFPGAMGQIGVIIAGALLGWLLYRRVQIAVVHPAQRKLSRHHFWASVSLIAFFGLLFGLPLMATFGGSAMRLFDSFYRAGSLVFGGGHVVLPLLRAELVPPGWMNDDAFLAGYGAAQAVPGPLFTFAAYLGTVIDHGSHAWVGGLWCLLAIFLPSWLLIAGSLPFWDLICSKTWSQAVLCGTNAAVVGVLLAALYNPVWKQAVTDSHDVAVVLGAFALLAIWQAPAWLVVFLTAATGECLL
jgi:chromate transporter